MATEWLTTVQAAELLGVHPTTLRDPNYRERNRIAAYRVGKRNLRFNRQEIEDRIRQSVLRDQARDAIRELLRPSNVFGSGN